ncbi:hypothetical protein ANO14919_002490 [Xylariales sp. No.14919]|nr:hypothetical protein ANO14919_002490 [Xylariales sp. No.14919]
MSAPQPKPRRRGGPRSRGGCENCKTRHIKCDETKPYCQRCAEKGRTCDGYSAVVDANQQAASALITSPITAYAIPFRIPGSQQDRRLLHYFCVRGAADLSGHLSSEFWTRLVLQHSHDNVPVRQAVVALSCVHQCYTTAQNSDGPVPVDAMVHYSRAMRSLRKQMSAGIDNKGAVSAVVPLICSVLFFCFENTQGNTEAALQHLDSGIAILARQKGRDRLVPENPDHECLELLEQMLTRLDLQASMFDDARLPLTRLTSIVESKTSAFDTFKTIDNAQSELTKLQNRMMRFLISNNSFKFWPEQNLPEGVKLEKQAIDEAYTEWNENFDRFVRGQSSTPGERGDCHSSSDNSKMIHGEEWSSDQVRGLAQDPAIAILRIHYHISRLLLAASLPYDTSVFCGPSGSPHYHTLKKVLDLIESSPQAHGAGSRSIGVETGIIAPLFLVVMKCTDPTIFGRAFNLLSAISGRREGMFSSRVLIEIATRVASQHQIPYIAAALEYQAGDALEERVNGLAGVAKNLGIIL